MKRNLSITTAVAAALAVTVAGCGKPSYSSYDDDDWDRPGKSYCADKSGRRVSESKCRSGGSSGLYGVYYLRNGYSMPAYGSRVKSGGYTNVRPSYTRATTSSYSSGSYSSSSTRGVFGSSSSSYGSASS